MRGVHINEQGEPTASYRLNPVEVEKLPVEVQDFTEVTIQFRGICGMYLRLIQQNRKIKTCNQLDWEITLGSNPIMPKNLPGHWYTWACLFLLSLRWMDLT